MGGVSAAGSEWHSSNRGISYFVSLYLFLFLVVTVLCKFLHDNEKLQSYLPEAALVILVGIAAGFLLHLIADALMYDDVAESLWSFSPTVFFVILLPPVIFNGGYAVNRDLFMRYITPVTMYACLGTTICTMFVACSLYAVSYFFSFEVTFLELAAFGAIVSATDPVSTLAVFSAKKVDPHMFYLVFGESMINDAVGLVLFNALAHLVERTAEEPMDVGQEVAQFLTDFTTGIVGSLVLGTAVGLAYGLMFKHIDMSHTPILELCAYMTILYFPFVVAETMHFSGIVTTLVTGFAARRYVEPNLSRETADTSDRLFRLTAHITETLIFLELGLSVTSMVGLGGFKAGFFALSLLACTVGRAVNVYPLTFVYNNLVACKSKSKKAAMELGETGLTTEYKLQKEQDHPTLSKQSSSSISETYGNGIDDTLVSWNKAHMLFFSGLRGAVSYALVKTFPATGNENIFQVTTVFIVLVTTFLFGGCTELALKFLNIPMNVDETEYLQAVGRRKTLPGALGRFESQTLRRWVIRDFGKNKLQFDTGSAAINGKSGSPAIASMMDGQYQQQLKQQAQQEEQRSAQEPDGLHYRSMVEMTDMDNRKGIYNYGH